MKIAVTSGGPDLDAHVDSRFGRCRCFLIVDLDDMSVEALENPNLSLGGGAGIQSAQLVAASGATVVLTGNCGPKAFTTLEATGIQVVVGVAGTVRDALEQYRNGGLSATDTANVEAKFGMERGAGTDG
jgi:predicted Fe-Mo cluster-binding NifX family protein